VTGRLRGLPTVLLLAAAVMMLGLVADPAASRADDGGANWEFAPAEAPPPPSGAEPSKFPAALGQVGDIAFWSPNRGVLITAGNAFVPAGLYAYDGAGWHQLSTVCGGRDGRIAWAGPDEFWTISDQRPGQITAGGENSFLYWDVSLCHFVNGRVVGSYATPVGQPDSYRAMDAAACDGPNDCWFGGELGEGANAGAFHLYWNGSALSVAYSPQDHAVASMSVDENQIYESVQLATGDSYGSESTTSPSVLHTIVPSDPGDVFHDVFPTEASCVGFCVALSDYGSATSGKAVAPDTLSGFALSSDWSQSGEGPPTPQLWAVAGPDSTAPPTDEDKAHPIALRYIDEEWTQVVPNLVTFASGEEPQGVAADPGGNAAWVPITGEDETAHVDLLSSADGGQTWSISAHDDLGPEQGVGPRGNAGPIACPAPHECWLATDEGWLFHLTNGVALPADRDPFFDGTDGIITYRPPDDGVPEQLPDEPPEDDSLANLQPLTEPAPTAAPAVRPPAIVPAQKKALVAHVHTHLLKGDVLELTFTLTGSAHVQLLGIRHGKVVTRTRRETLRKGSHTLKLKLSRSQWPTKLSLRATAA
jgi:hypothetical protein